MLVIPGAHGSPLDPSGDEGLGAKMGIDATIHLGTDEMHLKRMRVPGEEAVDPATIGDPRPAPARRGVLR